MGRIPVIDQVATAYMTSLKYALGSGRIENLVLCSHPEIINGFKYLQSA